jgi:hypothetical protein
MKQCYKCHSVKPLDEFVPDKKMTGGYQNKCRECRNVEKREDYRLYKTRPDLLSKLRARARVGSDKYRGRHGQKQHKVSRMAWALRNKHKVSAQRVARYAVQRGRIARGTLCERCGCAPKKLQMHHHDYTKPLDVLWLCTACHGKAHHKQAA